MIDARALIFLAPTAVLEAFPDDRDTTLQPRQRGRPRRPMVDAAMRAIEDNRFVLSAMSSRNWKEVYRASGVLQEAPQTRRNLRAALKARYQRRAQPKPHLGKTA
jgi:hypothetical protein